MHAEWRKHKHVTLKRLWQECREEHLEGYEYSRFCGLYRDWWAW